MHTSTTTSTFYPHSAGSSSTGTLHSTEVIHPRRPSLLSPASSSSVSSFSSTSTTSAPSSIGVTYTFCSCCGVDTSIFSHEDHCPKDRQS
ncbi:hypothetical protein [Absidia glauca]|uniref:Uncharacterized protein n=1 Tax=Absidia glauca TaxID=4829 RepID=A0A168MWE5_ABSGL|nr:hypothetical protein [Absidia glauca]